MTTQQTTIGSYLVDRLCGLGLKHAFGVPGDYVLAFYKMLADSPIKMIGSTAELPAGYAADAYARVSGLGCCVSTYGVGALSLANAVACAYAEKSPVVVVSGAPGLRERRRGQLLHHTFGAYDAQQAVFSNLTCANCVLDDPLTAFREIDRVLEACLRHKRPVYIELPRDRVTQPSLHPHVAASEEPTSDPLELQDAVAEAVGMLRNSRKPVILAGIEIERFGLSGDTLRLAERYGIPIAAMLLSKSVVPEGHPLYAGVYQAGAGRPTVTQFVEDADCLVMLGALVTDLDTGMFTHDLDDNQVIHAAVDGVRVRRHIYPDVRLPDFVRALAEADLPRFDHKPPVAGEPVYAPWRAEKGRPLSVARLFQKVNAVLTGQTTVISDPGDALFGAADLVVPDRAGFLAPAFYATLGWAIPAAVGAQLARPDHRPLVLVGDGSFQFTGAELSTAIRLGLDPIVIVLNNRGYLTERVLLDGDFNDIANWQFHKLVDVFGGGKGYEARTEDEFDAVLDAAQATRGQTVIINAHLPPLDMTPGLRRLGERLAKRV
ncbi:alpha-keto acid decarboxylase family protein [Fimbriiglobus ruber]|uniref:Pyruvate decarboxylase n=1 Tax=Fimbriiglobus ruber TaxID=1908690 RepID=A0A225D9Y7_9BACT|nr:thiamine pyrophosphate-binding protein [Fimbriiglobus ruber]OWK38371.1 Pyruvate decarboxylase [Fimbriiglobus ruber]